MRMVVIFLAMAGCANPPQPQMADLPDLARGSDLSSPWFTAEAGTVADLAHAPDGGADLAAPHDLATANDLSHPADLSQFPDLTPAQDLSPPCGAIGQACCPSYACDSGNACMRAASIGGPQKCLMINSTCGGYHLPVCQYGGDVWCMRDPLSPGNGNSTGWFSGNPCSP